MFGLAAVTLRSADFLPESIDLDYYRRCYPIPLRSWEALMDTLRSPDPVWLKLICHFKL